MTAPVDNRRSVRLGLVAGAATLVLAGAGVWVAALATSGGVAGARPADVVSSGPSAGTGTATSPAAAPLVPGTGGDRYARGVTAGATCSAAGSIGFTARMTVLRCATAAADPLPRWRTP